MRKKKKEQITLIGPEDYFDDCPVCQTMNKAEEQNRNLTEPEIKKAFKESKKQGAIVGGPLVSEESDKN